MNSRQVENIDRYKFGGIKIDEQHDFLQRRAKLPGSYSWILDLIPNHFKEQGIKNTCVLDLAIGAGFSSKYLEKKKMNVVKADLSMGSLKINNGQRVRCFADELPFKDESFNAIHFKDALVHIENKQKLFSEMHRVLRPSGVLLLTSAQNLNGPFFCYFQIENGKKIEKLHIFNKLTDYCKTVSQMETFDDIVTINPPYFVTTAREIERTLNDVHFKVAEKFLWKKYFWETDWYDKIVPRVVYFAKKE